MRTVGPVCVATVLLVVIWLLSADDVPVKSGEEAKVSRELKNSENTSSSSGINNSSTWLEVKREAQSSTSSNGSTLLKAIVKRETKSSNINKKPTQLVITKREALLSTNGNGSTPLKAQCFKESSLDQLWDECRFASRESSKSPLNSSGIGDDHKSSKRLQHDDTVLCRYLNKTSCGLVSRNTVTYLNAGTIRLLSSLSQKGGVSQLEDDDHLGTLGMLNVVLSAQKMKQFSLRVHHHLQGTLRNTSSSSSSEVVADSPSSRKSRWGPRWITWRRGGPLSPPNATNEHTPSPIPYRNPTQLLSSLRLFSSRMEKRSEETSNISHIGRKKKKILISGDSMMRQLFLRLVFLLRGEDVVHNEQPIVEHGFHADATYTILSATNEGRTRNSSHGGNNESGLLVGEDTLNIHDTLGKSSMSEWDDVGTYFASLKTRTSRKPQHSQQNEDVQMERETLLQVDFLWDVQTRRSRILGTKSKAVGREYALHICGLSTWLHKENRTRNELLLDFATYLRTFIKAKRSLMDLQESMISDDTQGESNEERLVGRTFHAPTIFIPPPFFPLQLAGKLPIKPQIFNKLLSERNGILKRHCNSSMGREKNVFFLDFGAISKLFTGGTGERGGHTRCDGRHFMCGFLPRFPHPINRFVGGASSCPANPCRDDVNAALVQLLVDHLELFG